MKFLTELWNRLTSSSPVFFKVIQWLSLAAVFVSGIPLALVEFETSLGVDLPSWVDTLSSKAVTIAGIIGYIIAKLPVKETETPPSELPFTKSGS